MGRVPGRRQVRGVRPLLTPRWPQKPGQRVLDTTSSWFVCYRRGVTHAGGNNVWYYTQGDRTVAGQTSRHAWGFMPAVDVWTNTDPLPGMPACPSGSTPPPPPPPAPTCISPTYKFYPGSALSNLRFGEVDIEFTACSNIAPANWSRSVTRVSTNSTGSLSGFSLTNASISTTSSGYGYADYTVIVTTRPACRCASRSARTATRPSPSGSTATSTWSRGTNAPHVFVSSAVVPFGYDLFTTP